MSATSTRHWLTVMWVVRRLRLTAAIPRLHSSPTQTLLPLLHGLPNCREWPSSDPPLSTPAVTERKVWNAAAESGRNVKRCRHGRMKYFTQTLLTHLTVYFLQSLQIWRVRSLCISGCSITYWMYYVGRLSGWLSALINSFLYTDFPRELSHISHTCKSLLWNTIPHSPRKLCQFLLYCVLKLCTVISTLRWAVLTVLWIGFCHTGPISLCIGSFVFVFVFWFCLILHICCIIVTRWGGPDGIEALSLGPYLSSVLWRCWLGPLTCKNPSPIWPVMCLVGR